MKRTDLLSMGVLLSVSILIPAPARAAMDFSSVPPARTVEESKARLEARRRLVLEEMASYPQGSFGPENTGAFQNHGLAKLATGTDTAAVNLAILDPSAQAYAKPGSSFELGPICRRNGDYDFMLLGLVRMATQFGGDATRLWPDAYAKILGDLFTVNGAEHPTTVCFDLCGCRADTENHILMTETSRYLANQLLKKHGEQFGEDVSRFDNALNGFDGWMLKHMRRFLKYGFSEYNARPYQIYSVQALQNIHDFSENAEVKLGARMVLDSLAARFALQSNGLRRSVPFRRKVDYAGSTNLLDGNGEAARYAVLAGNYASWAQLSPPYVPTYGDGHMVSAALTSYRIPDPVLDLMIRKDRGPYFQKILHPYQGVEIHWSSPSFMLSAGGRFVSMFDMGTGENDGRAQPTVLMPTRGGWDLSEFIRIAGHKKESKRQNTCVAPGFACGLNPIVPESIPAECRETVGNWTFINTTAAGCTINHSYHAVVFSKPCDTRACRKGGESFGFFEAIEHSKMSYTAFKSHVLEKNSRAFVSNRENLYITAEGLRIHFIPQPEDHGWEIVRLQGQAQERDFGKWLPAEGDVLTADGKGKMVFRNKWLDQCLVLDYRDPLKLRRVIEPCSSL